MRTFGIALCCVFALVALCVAPSRARNQEKDVWEPLRFLVGAWTGGGSGKPGDAIAGTASFAFDLDKKILVRKNRAEFAPKPGETKGAVHEDLMILYPQPGNSTFRAVYFDSEGHVIHYNVTFTAGQSSAVFETDPTEKGPRFRLVYEPGRAGALNTEFFVAPPGGDFKSYVKGTMKRVY